MPEIEVTPGVYEHPIVEKHYHGDLYRFSASNSTAEKVNEDISLNNELSIVADPFIRQNYGRILYVRLGGVAWCVSSITNEYPRLKLSFGGVYNGKQASTA